MFQGNQCSLGSSHNCTTALNVLLASTGFWFGYRYLMFDLMVLNGKTMVLNCIPFINANPSEAYL